MSNDKLLGMMGLAARARKLVTGTEIVTEKIKANKEKKAAANVDKNPVYTKRIDYSRLDENKETESKNTFNEGMQALADLINNPAPNRNIADFEGNDDD